MEAQEKQKDASRRIWRAAIVLTPCVWIMATFAIAQHRGRTMAEAATIGAVVALGELLTWTIYHRVSRRNDGLVFFIIALGDVVPRREQITLPLNEALTGRAVLIVVLALMALIIGLFVRSPTKGTSPVACSPLWDADFDTPRTG